MDTKNIIGLRPVTLRAAEPVTKPTARNTIAYGLGSPLVEDRGLRGRSPRPEQHEGASSRSIG